ncbi:DUF397 domain-containing protein [Nocardia pseudobrasiliensis]|uniref:Uncharacterized protein DUF397 n=1 Tax=Nocardia pseudobrasiliensis TaxID=45979 RepID=A0A370I4E5_9NOCA|nr:DUF397 domain-containing protein [Nocardia pseudobrasiliensis]RDI65565.1 uncharacterized protein DUF397 [Nocardia pseudobrasiliensis]
MSIELSSAVWFKSSRSGGREACVEVAHLPGGMTGIRDSKNPTGPALVFSPTEWDTFTAAITHGRFD